MEREHQLITIKAKNGSQKDVCVTLADGRSHLIGSDPEDDLIFRDAGDARVLVRHESLGDVLTGLSPGVRLNGQPVPPGASQPLPMPAQLVLNGLELVLTSDEDATLTSTLTSVPAAIGDVPPAPGGPALAAPKRRLFGLMCLLLVVCMGVSLTLHYLASDEDRARALVTQPDPGALQARWERADGVWLYWSIPKGPGQIKAHGVVMDRATEQRLRQDARTAGVAVVFNLTIIEDWSKELQVRLQLPHPVNLRHEGRGIFVLTIEGDKWPALHAQLIQTDFWRGGVRELKVVFYDAWHQAGGDRLALRYNLQGAMDDISRLPPTALEGIRMPEQTRRSIAMVQANPVPALVTNKRERIMEGAILANGVELLSVEKAWVTVARGGIVRRQRLG
jgi:hypothetical protein